MPSHLRTTLRRLVVPAVALAVVAAPLAASTASARPSTEAKAGAGSASSNHQRAVASLRAVQALTTQARGYAADAQARGTSPRRVDLTMALRDLANNRQYLTGADRAAADALFKRPTDKGGDSTGLLDYSAKEAKPVCTKDICIHYVKSSKDKPKLTDVKPKNGVPDYVDKVKKEMTFVHDTYLKAGYKEPKADGKLGGNSKIDIYLGEIGKRGLYGYCTSDEPNTSKNRNRFDRWAYCVLDNDYKEFPTNTPLENLQVTAAHEYFHATQYAYDRYEDAWILEATAAWVEDEMYDKVNDNLQYLAASALSNPETPVDTYSQATYYHYGTWLFFRHLTEKYSAKKGKLPKLVLDIFKKLDGSPGKPDQYSWQGVDTVLQGKGSSAAAEMALFAVDNRTPKKTYAEGQANKYPSAPLAASQVSLSTGSPTSNLQGPLDHLTSATLRYVPGSGVNGTYSLDVDVNMPPTVRGSIAIVASYAGSTRTLQAVPLNTQGDGTVVVPGFGDLTAVEVTLVNASGRFTNCFKGGAFSCQGKSMDDNLNAAISATAAVLP